MREAMVRRVLGEKWLVIMTLMPASEKVSWWGYADSSSSTIRTEGLQWKLAAEKVHITADSPKKELPPVTFLQQDRGGVTRGIILQIRASRQPVGQIQRGLLLLAVKVTLNFTVKPAKQSPMRGHERGGAKFSDLSI